MGIIYSSQPPEEPIRQEAEPGDFMTRVEYPDGSSSMETIELDDEIQTVKRSLLGDRNITNAEDYVLIAVCKDVQYRLRDDETLMMHLDNLVTEGDDSYLEIRLR